MSEESHKFNAQEVVNHWCNTVGGQLHMKAGKHSAECWKFHPLCALQRVYGEMSIDVERLEVEVTELQSSNRTLLDEAAYNRAAGPRAIPKGW